VLFILKSCDEAKYPDSYKKKTLQVLLGFYEEMLKIDIKFWRYIVPVLNITVF